MAENNMESGLAEGAVGAPNQQASAVAGVSQPSAIDVKALAEALRPVIAEEVERKTQSVKDKRFAKLEGGMDELLNRYDELVKEGLSPSRARREIKLDALLDNQPEKPSSGIGPAAQVGASAQGTGVDTQALLSNLGLDANDAEVVQALREKDLSAQLGKLAALSATKKAQPPAREPNAAAIMPTGGGQSVQTETLETLTAELEKEQARPIKDIKKIRELAAKQKALLPHK